MISLIEDDELIFGNIVGTTSGNGDIYAPKPGGFSFDTGDILLYPSNASVGVNPQFGSGKNTPGAITFSNNLLTTIQQKNLGQWTSTVTNLEEIVQQFGKEAVSNYKISFRFEGRQPSHNCNATFYGDVRMPVQNIFKPLYYSETYDADCDDDRMVRGSANDVYSGPMVGSPDFKGEVAIVTFWKYWGCDNVGVECPDWTDVKLWMRITGDVNVKTACENPINFGTDLCRKYCLDPFNPNCLSVILKNCFGPTGTNGYTRGSELILKSDNMCEAWYIQNQARGLFSTDIDDKITTICRRNNIGPEFYNDIKLTDPSDNDLSDNATPVDLSKNAIDTKLGRLCGCYLEDSVYTNFYNDFTKDVPLLKNLDVGKPKCFFPFCAISDFKPANISGSNRCQVPQCIASIRLDNRGGYIGGNATLRTNQTCLQQITGGGDGGPGSGGVSVLCTVDSQCPTGQECKSNVCKPKGTTPITQPIVDVFSFKNITITLIVIAVLIGLAVLGFFGYRYYSSRRAKKTERIQTLKSTLEF